MEELIKNRKYNSGYHGCISVGGNHIVGLKSNGTVVAAGNNDNSQCNINEWYDIIAVSAGTFHTVGLKADGTIIATGDNEENQCDISSWRDIIAISAGAFHTVGLKSNGMVVAVGYNEDGQCNIGGWHDIIAISAGTRHTTGLKIDGTIVESGYCSYTSDWYDITAISAGSYCTVGLKDDRTVIGDSGAAEWNDIIMISAGPRHTVGLKSDRTIVMTGSNYGDIDWYDIGLDSKAKAITPKDNESEQEKKQEDISEKKKVNYKRIAIYTVTLFSVILITAISTIFIFGRNDNLPIIDFDTSETPFPLNVLDVDENIEPDTIAEIEDAVIEPTTEQPIIEESTTQMPIVEQPTSEVPIIPPPTETSTMPLTEAPSLLVAYYVLPESNSRFLSEADIAGLDSVWLRIARNEIYARHGLIFIGADLREYFNSQSWYNGGTIENADFPSDIFNAYEHANIALIQRAKRQLENVTKVKTYKLVRDITASSTLVDSTGYVFHPSHVIDGDIRTAWVEGVDGFGLDEWIRLDFFGYETISGIDIWAGYFRDQRRFDINHRLKTAELEFSNGTRLTIHFDDVMEMQTFIFNEISTSYLKLIIKDVYQGNRDDDTCISEIKIFGYE
jgi:hypothetical protein